MATWLVAACSGRIGTAPGMGGQPDEVADDDGTVAAGGRVGAGGGGPSEAEDSPCGALPRRLWRLTPRQLENTLKSLAVDTGNLVAALEGFALDATASSRDLTVPHVQRLYDTLGDFAGRIGAKRTALAGCLASTPSKACVREAIAALVLKAFRRPATAEELDAYQRYFDAEATVDGAEVAIRQVAHVVLLSPHTLFRYEVGAPSEDGVNRLTAYERASFLSYTLAKGPPDGSLLEAAARGALDTAEGLADQAMRLLGSRDTAVALLDYFDELVGVAGVLSVAKDEKLFPGFGAEVRADMVTEFRAFNEHVLWSGDGRLETLLTAPYTFLNRRLGSFYGLPGGGDDKSWMKQDASEKGHAGLLTMGAFLAPHGLETDTDIVRRGAFIRDRILCESLPAPPADVNAFPPPPDGVLTNRERLAAHSTQATCAACHSLMDPLGYGLENFDSVGVYRTEDARANKPIDASGYLLTEEGEELGFEGPRALGALLAAQPAAHRCLAMRLQSFVLGRGLDEGGRCANPRFVRALQDGGVREGLKTLFSEPQFWERATP